MEKVEATGEPGCCTLCEGRADHVPVPPGVDVARYGSVIIWCKQFGVLISPAALSHSP